MSKATITTIRATSRASVQVGKNFYTVEYGEERQIPDNEPVDIQEERKDLWNTVNSECDNQIIEIVNTFSK